MIQKRKMKNFQVRALFEYFNGLVNKPGERPAYSLFVFNNQSLLSDQYIKIMTALNEAPDQEIVDYRNELNGLKSKFADRDEQNKIKTQQNGEPIITEMLVEYNKGVDALNKKHPEIQKKIDEYNAKQQAVVSADVEVNVDCLTLSEFINEAPPYVVGLLKA